LTLSDGADSNWQDETANSDLTAQKITNNTSDTGSQPTYLSSDVDFLNDAPVFEFLDDVIGSQWTNISPPLRIFSVIKPTESPGKDEWFYSDFDTTSGGSFALGGRDNWEFRTPDGTFVQTSTPIDQNPHLVELDVTASETKLILDETQIGSELQGGGTMEGFVVGTRYETARHFQANHAAHLTYDTSASGYNTTDVRNYLYNQYGDGSTIN
jgi:hypothetical protein